MSCSGCKAPASAEAMPPPWRNIQVVTSALSGILLALGFFGSMLGLPAIPETSLYLLAVAVGGRYFIHEGIETLLQQRQVGIEFLMTVAALGAGGSRCGADGRRPLPAAISDPIQSPQPGVIRQNLALSVLVIGGLAAGAVAGIFSLPIAVLAHEISEFVVIASGLRMLRR